MKIEEIEKLALEIYPIEMENMRGQSGQFDTNKHCRDTMIEFSQSCQGSCMNAGNMESQSIANFIDALSKKWAFELRECAISEENVIKEALLEFRNSCQELNEKEGDEIKLIAIFEKYFLYDKNGISCPLLESELGKNLFYEIQKLIK